MARSPIVPLTYDLARAVNPQAELSSDDLASIASPLALARERLLEDDHKAHAARFVEQPNRLLEDYRVNRHRSDLGRILSIAKRLNEHVDRVVLLGNQHVQLAARVLFEGCCHPFHNELSRGERGGYPRLDFAGSGFDNDALQGLLDLLGRDRKASDVTQRWGIVVVDNGNSLEVQLAWQQFLSALRAAFGNDDSQQAKLVVAITGSRTILAETPGSDVFHPAGIDPCLAIFTPAALLPAAIAGLDIVKLIRGAAAMNAHFRQVAVDRNLTLQFAATAHLMHTRCGRGTRVQAMWSHGLEATGRWLEQLHPGNAFRVCDHWQPFSPAGSFITNFLPSGVRRDRLKVVVDGNAQIMPELLALAVQRSHEKADGMACPSVDLHLPQLDETSLGHLLQMLMLSAAIENRLVENVPS